MLHGFNESRCKPPVSRDELSKIAHNAATQADRPDFKDSAVDPNIERLGKLSPLEYDQQRKAEAKKMGVRPSTLDAEVAKARPKGSSIEHESLALRRLSHGPIRVDGLALLNALRNLPRPIRCRGQNSIVRAFPMYRFSRTCLKWLRRARDLRLPRRRSDAVRRSYLICSPGSRSARSPARI